MKCRGKLVSYTMMVKFYKIDPASPTGLAWSDKPNYTRVVVGNPAGTMLNSKTQKSYWVINSNKKQYKAHRVVMCLHLGRDITETEIVTHVDGNPLNNKTDNLMLTTRALGSHICCKCATVKTAENFTKNRNVKSGLSLYCKSCMTGVIDNKYDLDFTKFVEYSEVSPTKLVWKEDRSNYTKAKTRIKKGDVAGSLKLARLSINLNSYSLPVVILSLFGQRLPAEHCISYKDGNRRNFSIGNLEIIENQKITKIKKKLQYRSRVNENFKTRHERKMLNSAKERAIKSNYEFNIDVADIIIPAFCPILKIPLFKGKGKVGPNSPSLDRKDSSKGYIKGNVWVVSQLANTMKTNADRASLLIFAKWVINEYS